MDEWSRDRVADLEQGAAELEAKGHQLYGEGIRKGRDMIARTSSEVRELAKGFGAPAHGAARPSQPSSHRDGVPASQHPSIVGKSRDRDGQILENARRLVDDAQEKAGVAWRGAENTRAVRDVAGLAANMAGNAAGVGRGTVHMGRDLADGAVFGIRLLDPTDAFRHPPEEAAWGQAFGALGALGSAAKETIVHPRAAAQSLVEKGGKLLRDTIPMATPEEPTLSAEMRRRFDIGRNQGELAVELVPYAIGAGELKAATELGSLTKASRIAKYTDQGFTLAQAERLARPYRGKGHHSIIPERARLPDWLGGAPIPRAILDSEFNVLKPKGMTQGDFYELHYKVDPEMRTMKLRGGQWSGEKLGLQKYDLPERIWFGTPNATKRAIASAGMAGTVPFDGTDPR